jgi:hypothetical protein
MTGCRVNVHFRLMVCLVEDGRRAGGAQLAREKGAGASADS